MSEILQQISIYKGVSDKTGSTITIPGALQSIQNGTGNLMEQIIALRKATGPARDELKKQLPAVTWCGTFTARKKDGLKQHSGIVCHDIDKLTDEDLHRYKKEFETDPHIYACFISPSGNGLKILFQVSTLAEQHTDMFNSIGAYLVNTYGVVFDEKCKDISRLCFLSFDPHLILHEDAKILSDDFIQEWNPKKKKAAPKQTAAVTTSTDKTETYLQKCHTLTGRTQTATDGGYNQYVNVFALQANRYGLPANVVIEHLEEKYGTNENKTWVRNTVNSVYNNFTAEHGKFLQDTGARGTTTRSKGAASLTAPAPGKSHEYDETIFFWDKFKKGEDPATGREIFEYKFSYQKSVQFLRNNGFGKIRLENNSYKFVRIRENIVEEVTGRIMKEFMLGYINRDLQKNTEGKYEERWDELYLVREMFLKGSKTYCSDEKMEALDYFDNLQFKTDTATTIFFYFKNCFVEITKDGFTEKTYSELGGLIWQRQIVDKNFSRLETKEISDGEFNHFLQLSVCGAEVTETNTEKIIAIHRDEKALKKYDSAKSAIGYGISRHKNRAIAKAIVFVDKKLRHGGNESNGGSGKGICVTAVSKVRHAANIDGKTFRFDANFPYTMISEDHELVHFEDVKKGFDIEMLFNPITGGWEIRKLHENSYQIPFEKSPKIFISTNFSLKGTGSSFLRRQHIIELSNFFNEKYTPLDHFEHLLFDDWNETEWHRFHNFMIVCCQLYLSQGLIEFPLENYHTNKLVDAAGEEFVDWMDEKFGAVMATSGKYSFESTGIFALGAEYERNEMFEAFKKDFPNTKQYQAMTRTNTFTGWVKEWCNQRGLELLDSKSGSKYKWKFV